MSYRLLLIALCFFAAYFFWFLASEDGWGWRIPAVYFVGAGVYYLA